MPTEKSNPTMKDVAREAGVAIATVSKVVNGLPVGKEYRVRVEKAIKKLNYQVNSYAQGLRNDRTRTIQVIIPNLTNPFFAELVNCIVKELAQRDYRTMLCMTDGDPSLEQAHVLTAKQHMADGIICLSYNPTLQVPENVPLVSIDRYFGAKIPCVSSDNYGGGRLAAEKLMENGCGRLAFLRVGTSLASETNMSKSKDASAEGDGLAQAYATFAAVTFNGDTVTSCYIDAVQANVNFDTAGKITTDLTVAPQTKNELGDGYGMRKASSIGKEWNEQAAGFCAYVTGKTVAEIKGLAVDESGKAADADLAATTTVGIGEFQTLIEKAAK